MLELLVDGAWVTVGKTEPEQRGSLSNRASGRREVLVFSTGLGRSKIERSIAGGDVEFGGSDDRSLRQIDTVGFETLAELWPGDVYPFELQTDRMAVPQSFRFRQT